MMEEKIPLLLFPSHTIRKIGFRMRSFGRILSAFAPKLSEVLPKLGINVKPQEYAAASFVSSFIYGLFFFGIVLLILTFRETPEQEAFLQAVLIGLTFWFFFFVLHMQYPGILLRKIAARQSKDLLFALREIMIDIESGVPLYDSMKNVAQSDYRSISSDFEWVTRQIDSGWPEREALKHLALKSENDYLKRALWQLLNAIESGASLHSALAAIVQSLENYLYREIKSYSSNLNFLMLIYMMVSAALPSLGITLLVLLSAFSGLGVSVETIGFLVLSSAILQIILIGYMSTTRPEIFGG